MAALRDRVKVTTSTNGTGSLNLSTAVAGYRSFQDAYAADALVTYVIEDGITWETGQGYFSKAGNSLIRQTIAASSSNGSAIYVNAASATVSVAYLAVDSIADWPYFDVFNGNGGDSSTTQNGAYFPTMMFGNAAARDDTHNGWNPSTAMYTVPQTGVYDITFKWRLPDGTQLGVGYGMGVDNTNGDSPNFQWYATTNSLRFGALYRRVTRYNAGDQLRAFTYIDGPVNGYTYSAMTIFRIR